MALESVLIRCDGGSILKPSGREEIASGHLMRMLSFAKECKKEETSVFLALHESCRSVQTYIELFSEIGCRIFYISSKYSGSEEDAIQTLGIARSLNIKCLYLDGYHFLSHYQSILAQKIFLIQQDDTGSQGPYYADIIVSSHIHAHHLRYETLPSTKKLLGPKYAFINDFFQEWRLKLQDVPLKANRLLVTFGSADSQQDSERCLNEFLKVSPLSPISSWLKELEITIIVGAMNERLDQIRSLANALQDTQGTKVNVLKNVRNMALEMAKADFALSAAGGTVLELMCLGVPIALQINHQTQVLIANCMIKEKSCIFVGDAKGTVSPDEITNNSLIENLFQLSRDYSKRLELRKRGMSLVDAQGAKRVYDVIKQRFMET